MDLEIDVNTRKKVMTLVNPLDDGIIKLSKLFAVLLYITQFQIFTRIK